MCVSYKAACRQLPILTLPHEHTPTCKQANNTPSPTNTHDTTTHTRTPVCLINDQAGQVPVHKALCVLKVVQQPTRGGNLQHNTQTHRHSTTTHVANTHSRL